MSFSVDDLVSSLSSSHIGQEAMDLATLQNQLAETLFCSHSSSNNSFAHAYARPNCGRSQNTQPCNTPLVRTPSTSVSFSHSWGAEKSRRGSFSSPNFPSTSYFSSLDDMEEDERMVEELLIPSSPLSTSISGFHHNSAFPFSTANTSSSPATSSPTSPQPSFTNPFTSNTMDTTPSSPNASLFTSTDPFYIAQLQASQTFSNNVSQNFTSHSGTQSQSVFAKNGLLTQGSPFAISQYHQFHSHGQNWDSVGMSHSTVPIQTCAAAF